MLQGTLASSQQTPGPPVSIGVGTELVLVDVIATDKHGRPVTDLGRDEFVVLEDGRPVEIAVFRAPRAPLAAERAGASASGQTDADTQPEPATLVIYLENATLTAGGRRQVLDTLRSFIGQRLPSAGFRALVIGTGGGARAASRITASAAEIESVLVEVGRTTGGGVLARSDERQVVDTMRTIVEACEGSAPRADFARCTCLDVLDDMVGVARVHAEARNRALLQTIARLSGAVSALASLPGRKALLYVSQDMEQHAGQHLFNQIGDICPEALQKDFGRVFGRMEEYDVTSELRDLTARANAARVTFYPLDASGLEAPAGGDASSGERRYMRSPRTETLRVSNVRATLELLAQETGGFTMVNSNDASRLLGKLPSELAARYDIGFAPAREADGRRHSIRVRLQHGKGLTLRYRGSYFHAPRGAHEADRLLAALLYGMEEDALDALVSVDVSAADAERSTGRTALVRVSLPVGKLATEAGPSGPRARLRLLIAVRKVDAAPSDRPLDLREKEVTLELSADGPDGEIREFVVEVPLGEGAHELAVGVHDALSTKASYRTLRVD